ncbi:MAG: hypothetical protein QW756_08105 [Nitrososphaerota archaeon]
MSDVSRLLGVGSILAVIQVLFGAANRLVGPVFTLVHVILAIILLILLVVTLLSARGMRRVLRHTLITLVLLLIQGGVGLEMLSRGFSGPVSEVLHWVFGFLTAGSYVGAWLVARRV